VLPEPFGVLAPELAVLAVEPLHADAVVLGSVGREVFLFLANVVAEVAAEPVD